MNRLEAVNEIKSVYIILANDLESALQLGRADPNQFAHRTLIRTYFAFVEGLSFQLRQVTLASLQNTDLLTPGELSLLREERFQLSKKGIPEARENFQSILPNLLFSIHCYVKNHGAKYQPDIGHHGWDAMRHAVEIRNRLTHPKSAAGLEVTNNDLGYFIAGADWWKMTLLEMFAACEEADNLFRSNAASK